MDTTRPKDFVFVLMPFSDDFDDVYKLGIKEACREAGVYCERVDEQIYSENMLDRIYNQISKADFLIADMSDKNPNVFYEVGYAHALGKNVILITQRSEDIPFDLRHYPHIVYNGKVAYLKEQLTSKVKYFSRHRSEKNKLHSFPLKLFMAGVELLEGETSVEVPYKMSGLLGIEVIVFNISNEMYDKKFKVSLYMDSSECGILEFRAYETAYRENSFIELNNKMIQIVNIVNPLYPQEPFRINFLVGDLKINKMDLVLRIHVDSGILDYPVSIIANQEVPF